MAASRSCSRDSSLSESSDTPYTGPTGPLAAGTGMGANSRGRLLKVLGVWFGISAAVGVVIGEYSGELIPALRAYVKLVAVLIIIGFFLLQWRGIKWGRGTQLVTAAMKTLAFVVVVLACFLFGGHARTAASASAASSLPLPSGWPLALSVLLGLQAVIYTIDGWDGIIY